MKKRKKLISLLLCFVLLVTNCLVSNAAYEDENNVTGSEDFTFSDGWDGTPSDDAWTYSKQAMWKVTVYVAKDSATHYDTAGANLTDDYYLFGKTFWLYRDGYGPETTEAGGVAQHLANKTVVDARNKEEYLRGGATYKEFTYSSVSNLFFAGSNYLLNGERGEDNIVPFIPGFGDSSGTTAGVEKFFGNKNYVVSNALINMAKKAGGISDINAWLSSKTFTINGETKSGWEPEILTAIIPNSATVKQHNAHVSWVFLYEPVFIVNNIQNSGYVHFVTPSAIAKSAMEGTRDYRSTAYTSDAEYKKLFTGTTVPDLSKAKAMGLGLEFAFYKFPSSIYLSNSWLGFLNGNNRTPVTVSGIVGKYWSALQMLQGGGVGIRYQRADDYLPTVELTKTVNGASSGTLSGFEFTFKNNTTGESLTFVTDSKGKITTFLPAGKYTVTETPRVGYETAAPMTITVGSDLSKVYKFTVNNVYKSGSLHISKVAEDQNYSGTSFTVSSTNYNSFTVKLDGATSGTLSFKSKDGKTTISASYTITYPTCSDGSPCARLNVYGLPVGNWTVTESRPSRYNKTLVGASHVGQTEGLSYTASVSQNAATFVRFDNFTLKTGSIHISKVAEDQNYSGTSFILSHPNYNDVTVSLTATSQKSIILTEKSNGRQITAPMSITYPTCSDGSPCARINIYGLPVGDWTVTENRPARYGETYVGANHVGQTKELSYTASVSANAATFVRFDNFLATYSLSIVKRIKAEDIVWAHGNPIFFFKVASTAMKGVNGTTIEYLTKNNYYSMEFTKEYVESYLQSNPDAEYVEMSVDITDFSINSYNKVSELEVMRYKLAENGIEILEGTGNVSATFASIPINSNNAHPVVCFTNDKVDQQGCSANSIVINEFKIGE